MLGRREMLKVLVLSVIALGETHGYEIGSRIAQLTGGHVRLSPGTLYPLLLMLRREGLIEISKVSEEGRKKKVYRLTPKGREYLVFRLATAVRVLRCLADFLERVSKSLEEDAKPETTLKDVLLYEKNVLLNLKERIERRIETIDRIISGEEPTRGTRGDSR